MNAALGGRPVLLDSPELGVLDDATADRADRSALLHRLREDGYIRLRGFHPRDSVLAARAGVLESGASSPALTAVVAGERMLSFASWLFGGEAMTYDHRWTRVVQQRQRTPVHCDRVFMGRGSEGVITCWTPLGDVPVRLGPIALWLGSAYQDQIVSTYGAQDVDRDLIHGYVADDPWECAASMGGRWHSADFEAGDVLLFGMQTLHGSLDNTTSEPRVSCDTRYQRADEPADDRWVGNPPRGHDRWPNEPLESLEAGRKRWGLPTVSADH